MKFITFGKISRNTLEHKEKKAVYLRRERDEAFFEAYNRAIRNFNFSSQVDAIDYVRLHDAPRFYIEPEFCSIVIGRMLRGVPTGVTGEASTKRFDDLFKMFLAESAKPSSAYMSVYDICDIIVNKPAPQFYIGFRTARHILSKERTRKCQEIRGKVKSQQ